MEKGFLESGAFSDKKLYKKNVIFFKWREKKQLILEFKNILKNTVKSFLKIIKGVYFCEIVINMFRVFSPEKKDLILGSRKKINSYL